MTQEKTLPTSEIDPHRESQPGSSRGHGMCNVSDAFTSHRSEGLFGAVRDDADIDWDPFLGREDEEKRELTPVEEEEVSRKMFADVLDTLDQMQLPILGETLLKRRGVPRGVTNTVPVVGEPIFGGYNVLFPLTFSFGPKWLVKIHVDATPGRWSSDATDNLRTEALTMGMLKRQSSIPLPEVVDYCASCSNVLNCAYIVMTYIDGETAGVVWDAEAPPEVKEPRRMRILDGVAAAMVQLGMFSFDLFGAPRFGADGSLAGIGPVRLPDSWARYAGTMRDLRRLRRERPPAVFVQQMSTEDPRAVYNFFLPRMSSNDMRSRAEVALLRHLVKWIKEPCRDTLKPFVLTHPDLSLNNVIVSAEGELRGIVDWDGVCAMPRSIGNECYPIWLTEDWGKGAGLYNKAYYWGISDMDSPETLIRYRAAYNNMIAKHGDPLSTLCCTRSALIASAVHQACVCCFDRKDLVKKIMKTCWKLGVGAKEKNWLEKLYKAFDEDDVSEDTMSVLKRGFDVLFKDGYQPSTEESEDEYDSSSLDDEEIAPSVT